MTMLAPVQCNHCLRVYDLTGVERIARYADCDVFKTPCCGRTADTRPWKSLPDYETLRSGQAPRSRVLPDGTMVR